MENSLQHTNYSQSSSVRQRKSIFANQKCKIDSEQPRLLLNGETLTDWRPIKSSTSPNFYSPSKMNSSNNMEFNNNNHNLTESRFHSRPMKGYFHLPQHAVSRAIITDSTNTNCIRPFSAGKKSVVINSHQIIQKPTPIISTTILPSQKQILGNSIIIPSQSSNIITSESSNLAKTSMLKRKCIITDGKPHESVIFRHSPIKQQPVQIIQQIRPQVSKIIIQDDPKTISELNKLNSLNQFLTQQYNLINNELIDIRNRTSEKEVVEERIFLEKSLNKIDDIFIRETTQALFKLDEISRCASSKGFLRSGSVKKRNQPHSFSKDANFFVKDEAFTPIKVVQQMQNNSSYIDCSHHQQLNINTNA